MAGAHFEKVLHRGVIRAPRSEGTREVRRRPHRLRLGDTGLNFGQLKGQLLAISLLGDDVPVIRETLGNGRLNETLTASSSSRRRRKEAPDGTYELF